MYSRHVQSRLVTPNSEKNHSIIFYKKKSLHVKHMKKIELKCLEDVAMAQVKQLETEE